MNKAPWTYDLELIVGGASRSNGIGGWGGMEVVEAFGSSIRAVWSEAELSKASWTYD